MAEYIGNRVVPKHCGVWDSTVAYEPLSIVLEASTGDSYTSRKDVPAGTGLNQTEYWAKSGVFNAQLKETYDGIVADNDATEAAVKSDNDATETAVKQDNESTKKYLDGQVESMTAATDAAVNLTTQNRSDLEKRMTTIESRLDANVSASTDANADYAAEVVDARTDAKGNTSETLGGNIRNTQSGDGILDKAIRRNKIVDVAFDQVDIDGLDVRSFDSIEVIEGMQFVGYDTETFLPIYREDAKAADGVVYDFKISELTDRGVTEIFFPMGTPLTQRCMVYTAGEKATNALFKSSDQETGMYTISDYSAFLGYERVAISFHKDNAVVKCIRDCSDLAESRILKWIGTKDLKDGIVTEDKLEENIPKHLNHYPFDYTKETEWQTEYGRRHKEGLIPFVAVYDCDPNYEYGIGAIYRNHATNHTRYVSIAKYERETLERVETIAQYEAKNDDDADPEFVELISLSKNGMAVVDIVIDWTKETLNDWRGYEIFQPGLAVPYSKFDEDRLDDKYILTQSGFNDFLQDSFPFTGNLVSQSKGEHRRSTGYDVDTKYPIWLESDNYREFTLEIPPYGKYVCSRRDAADTQSMQIYLLRAGGTVIYNSQDKTEKEEPTIGFSVGETEVCLDCAKAYKWGARYFSIAFDIRKTPDFYINAVNNQLPSWLAVDWLRDKALVSSQIETVLPSKLEVCGGVEMNVYYPNIVRYLNTEKCQLVKPSSTFSGYDGFARWTPETDSSATFSTTFNFYMADTYATNITSTVMAVGAVPRATGDGEKKRVMLLGDSLTDADSFSGELVNMFSSDVMDIELVGTLGSGENKNEGRSGWRAYTYVRCENGSDDLANLSYTNPFYNPEKEAFDFSYYMEQQGFDGVDYVFICLGTNDIARGNYKTEEELQELWDYMISSIHEYDPNIRIGLWLPPTRSLMANRNRQAIDSSLWMNKWLIATYDNREDERIYLVPVYLNVDPYHDYRYQEVQISSRNPNFQMVIDSDAVHPSTYGYYKIADVLFSYIKYFAYLDS